ncbi:MAG: hypothetical protein QM692_17530 [Thermomicrobiales bacterium]
MPSRQYATSRRHAPCASHRVLLLSALFLLVSLCHGLVAAPAVDAAGNVAAITAADGALDPAPVWQGDAPEPGQNQPHNCTGVKRLAPSLDRRWFAPAALDLPVDLFGFAAAGADQRPGRWALSLSLPGQHRSVLQVFRL